METSARPRRICYFVGTHGDWGGASRIIFNIIRHLDRRSFEPVVMLTTAGPICRELDEAQVRYHVWKHHVRFSPLKHIVQTYKAWRFYRRERIDLIGLSFGCLGWLPAELLAAWLARVPIIQHCQQVVRKPSPYTRFSALVLTCSEYVREQSSFGRVTARRLYDIVEIDRFDTGADIRQELGIAPSDLVVTFLGRKRKSKGLDAFVELTRLLPEPTIRFVLAVQRTARPNADTYTDAEFDAMLRSDPRIVHVGFRPDVQNIYAASDVIVMPSGANEPCPAVALEAAASGKPIVATDTGATGELITDGETGFLVARGDMDALLNRVRQLIADSELRVKMGHAAQLLARRKFFEEPVGELHAILRSICLSRPAR
jgi:glycosyltransferase involved in cell wall biosynthesis